VTDRRKELLKQYRAPHGMHADAQLWIKHDPHAVIIVGRYLLLPLRIQTSSFLVHFEQIVYFQQRNKCQMRQNPEDA